MNDLKAYNVKLPDGGVTQIISNKKDLKKEIFQILPKNIPYDNILLFDDQLSIYSLSTLLSTELSQFITVMDASTLIQELLQMNALKELYEKILQEYEKIVNVVQMLNVDSAKKDFEINVLKNNQIKENQTKQELRQTLGEYDDKYRALWNEHDQLKKKYQKLDEDFTNSNKKMNKKNLKLKKMKKQLMNQKNKITNQVQKKVIQRTS